jgi:putative inorganic carbon (HCO3(-)) transporter
MCLSSAAAVHADATVPQVTNFVLEGFVLYLLVSNAAADARRWRRILWVIVLAAVAMSLLAVFQELTKSYDSTFGGFAQVSAGGFDVAEDGSIVKQLRPRLAGPIGEQNRFAQVLLAAAPLAYFGARASPLRSRRIVGYGSAAVIVSGVLVTFSRGASVAMGGLIMLALVHRFVRLRQVVLIGALLAGAIIVVAPDYMVRLASLTTVVHAGDKTSREADGAIRGRQVELLAAWNTFVGHPAVGVGPGRFFREYSQIEANKLSGAKHLDTERRAHNLYAELLADLGLVGFGAFAAANAVTIRLLIRARRRWRGVNLPREYLAAAALFALYSYLLTAFFLQLSYQRYYWALLAMCNGVAFSLLPARPGTTRARLTGAVSPRLEPVFQRHQENAPR